MGEDRGACYLALRSVSGASPGAAKALLAFLGAERERHSEAGTQQAGYMHCLEGLLEEISNSYAENSKGRLPQLPPLQHALLSSKLSAGELVSSLPPCSPMHHRSERAQFMKRTPTAPPPHPHQPTKSSLSRLARPAGSEMQQPSSSGSNAFMSASEFGQIETARAASNSSDYTGSRSAAAPSYAADFTNAGGNLQQERPVPTAGGLRKRKFVAPKTTGPGRAGKHGEGLGGGSQPNYAAGGGQDGGEQSTLPPELAHCEEAMVAKIRKEIMTGGDPVRFGDIAGLESVKKSVVELVCWPMARPDLFTGLRSLPKGLLLFGPPGTGKTLIGKAIAHQSKATFFSISASSLMSKWIGEGEKLVRALFAVAAYDQPSVIFIDEVDSMLTARSSDEAEASRRLKTEFLIQLDGAQRIKSTDQVLVIGATNRPEELDEAARRRFVKRLYVPLPEGVARQQLIKTLLHDSETCLSPDDIASVVQRTEGYSGADIHALCTEASMGPVRDMMVQGKDMSLIEASEVPPISREHFEGALRFMRPSVSGAEVERYVAWADQFASNQVERK
ncbi:unnamed protein product [Chrysoparadoxa australica]